MTGKWRAAGAILGTGAAALALTAMAETQSYTAGGFDRIDVASGLSVVYSAGDSHSVSADFERGGPEDVSVEVDGDTLEIQRKRGGMGWGRDSVRATFTVTSPELRGVEVSSGASFAGTGIDAERFELELSSGASASLSGRCGEIEADVASGASADAEGLSCREAEIDAASGASISLAVSEELSVDASSGASVKVSGSPEVRELDQSSGARVRIEPGAL